MGLTKEQILSQRPAKTKPVPVPAWGGDVFVRVMTGSERDGWEVGNAKERESNGPYNVRGRLLARTICDETGKRLFTDADAGRLGQLECNVLDAIYDEAAKLNGIRAEDVKESEKNLSDSQSELSGSDSPAISA